MEADKELLSAFVTRFDELKILEPPVADAPFKSYLNDLVGKLTSLKTEFRNKRRSAIRRHEKEQDPLALALADLTVKADALTHLLKCTVANCASFLTLTPLFFFEIVGLPSIVTITLWILKMREELGQELCPLKTLQHGTAFKKRLSKIRR